MKFVVEDWAGNLMNFGTFNCFDEAEAFLSEHLRDYESDRQEYFIVASGE